MDKATVDRQRLARYLAGFSDRQLARAEGIKPDRIRTWRFREGLPTKHANRFWPLDPSEEQFRRALYSAGASDNSIAKLVDRAPRTIKEWRDWRKLPANNPRRGREKRRINLHTCLPLDAKLFADGAQIHDIIKDESHSSWLEEMGATVW